MVDGESSETYFLYDCGTVIMESDKNGVTAKNTYAGPLLLRTVYGDAGSKNYQYMYNAHGDVVTLRSDGEIAATYYYDAFGNVLSTTGEADNSILYAGYQYDEETGLYYVNARMYDPVTARFLQADTYRGNLNDPLSLNLYTYCLNNPDRYVDPSGHSAVLTILGFVAARVIIGLAAGIVSAGMEVFNQKVIEKRTRVNYDLVLFEGISNGIIAMTTSAVAAIGKNAAKQTAKVAVRKIGRKFLQGVALGAAEGMAMDVGRQIIEGTKIKDVSFTQALSSGVTGGIFGAAGVGINQSDGGGMTGVAS